MNIFKNYGVIETPIVECRRATLYVLFHYALNAIFALVAIIVGIVQKSIGVLLLLLLLDAIEFIIYYLSVKTTVIGITRHFIVGHKGLLFTHLFVIPLNKTVTVTRRSTLFERIFGATTITVKTSGGYGCTFSSMDVSSTGRLFDIFQKYVIIAERNANSSGNKDNG